MMPLESRHPDCLDTQQLAAFTDGGLSPEERARIETHVAGCEDCYEAVAEVAATLTALGPAITTKADPARTSVRRPFIRWVAPALAAAAAVLIWINTGQDAIQSGLTNLANEPRQMRLGLGRSSVDVAHADAPTIQRSGAGSAGPAETSIAAQELVVAAASDESPRGLQAYGLALFASRQNDRAIAALDKAAKQSPGDASIHSDLAAVYLERSRMIGSRDDAELALREADRALAVDPRHLAGAFNRAQALTVLERAEARQAWQAYIDLDKDSAAGWAREAMKRRDTGR